MTATPRSGESILEALGQAAGWEQVHAAFVRHGLEIRPYGNGLVIKDRNEKALLDQAMHQKRQR